MANDGSCPFKIRTSDLGVRQWLAILVVGCILPLSGAAAVLISNFYQHEQAQLISHASQQAHTIISAVERDIAHTEAALPLGEMTTELRNTLLWLVVATIVALSAGLELAWLIGGNIAKSITALIQPATAIGSNDILPIPHLYFREASQLGRALQDASSRSWQSQVSLREKDLQLTQAADAAKLGIWTRDFVGNEIWASDQWRVLFGFSGVQTIEIEAVLSRIHPDDLVAVSQVLTTLQPPDWEYDMEYRLQLPDGGIRWIASRGHVDYDNEGNALRSRGISFDITLRKQAELNLRQKKIEIMHLSRVAMLGGLSGALAHELNQPLTSILSNAQAAQRFLAKDDVDLNEVRDILQDIVDEDIRAGEVIRRLRGLLTAGEIQVQSVDVNYLVSEVGKLLHSDLITQGVELRMECAADLKRINADPVQLQQVMINLIMNACDAIKTERALGRRIVVRTGFYDADNAEVAVIDQGHGIAADSFEKIFDAFYTTKENGMGLGLSICRNIIEANGGRIWAENDPGHGASFRFCLPLRINETP